MKTTMTLRGGLAATALLLGALQAWDSHVLSAEPNVQLLVALAIVLVPIALLATPRTPAHLAAAATAIAVLALARVVSSVPLPEIVLAALFPAVLVLLLHARALANHPAPASRA
jgi:hypothetical protein